MKIVRPHILIAVCLFLTFAGLGQDAPKCDSCKSIPEPCRDLLHQYQYYWQKDSIGEYGFRDFFSTTVIGKYSFKGVQWKALKSYLGEPNNSYLKSPGADIRYRYKLRYRRGYVEDYSDINAYWMDIFVNEQGVITGIALAEMDG